MACSVFINEFTVRASDFLTVPSIRCKCAEGAFSDRGHILVNKLHADLKSNLCKHSETDSKNLLH